MEKYCRVRQSTDDNMAHAHCMLDNYGYKHTLTMCNTRCNIYIYIYIYIAGSQKTTKFIALYCTICYTTTCFDPLFRPLSGCICLALRVLYYDDKFILF